MGFGTSQRSSGQATSVLETERRIRASPFTKTNEFWVFNTLITIKSCLLRPQTSKFAGGNKPFESGSGIW